ncbi:hypothetical protein HN51_044100 [Arachis hypogaea]|uniref:50S ribosomal protein L33, chloroplastic n=1 Tax=Arachis hypogaea TaxID=3818 RepID=A0A444Y4A5_ARAHY|nr:uncharacterized protein LOC107612311 [Arachis ipaensis]XP_025671991.1 uncharacterized protein LOC112771450 [Arachis hypogaea]QHN96251.1 50S ribosomal protein [Arachis hypogaea]RYQ96686.1 hypothetical protein Ahy_B08g092527 [Arachis hypogaea]
MATAIAIAHFCPGRGLTLSCYKRNRFHLHHLHFSSTSLSHAVFSRGYLSTEMFTRPKVHPIICMAKRYAPNTTKRKRLSRKRGGDPDKKRHRRRKGSKKKLFKIIRLVSAAGTGFFYAKKKSRRIHKIDLKKYDPKVKLHVLFTEAK